MRKAIFTLAAAAALLTACQAEKSSVKSSTSEIKIQMTAITEDDSRTSIDETNAVTWGKGEYVKMYYNDGTDKFATSDATSADINAGSLTADFDFTITPAEAASYKLGGMYPASAAAATEGSPIVKAVIPSVQNATATSYDPAAYIMVIRPEEVAAIPSQWQAWFRKAAALNKVTLTGVKDDIVAVEFTSTGKNFSGAAAIDMTSGEITGYSDNESTVKVQYASALPAGNMDIWFTTWESKIASGETLTINAITADGCYSKTITARADGISFTEGCLNKLTVDFSAVEYRVYTDLSAVETANCYIVPQAGLYKFKANVKGNGTTIVPTVRVAHLWSTYNTATAPENAEEIIKNISYSNGYATFEATGVHGNVIVAAYDESDVILWSWHLWCTAQPADVIHSVEGASLSGATMLDRNLGALSAKAVNANDVSDLGFLYEWGRKDPFTAASTRTAPGNDGSQIVRAAVCGQAYTKVEASSVWDTAKSSVSYSIAHPTAYLANNSSPYNWTKSEALWGSTKTIYDPCPVGYQMPRVMTGAWGYFTANTTWDSTLKGRYLTKKPEVWYPAVGNISYAGEYPVGTNTLGVRGKYWGYDYEGNNGNRWYEYSTGCELSGEATAFAFSVRCQKSN